MSLLSLLAERIRHHGPLTVAEYMDYALYHSELGYYSSSDKRSGQRGDFFTSVDLGSTFGKFLAIQLAEMHDLLLEEQPETFQDFDLVEVGSGNGQLARDILDTVEKDYPRLYKVLRVQLVERSIMARAAQTSIIGPHLHLLKTQPKYPDLQNSRGSINPDIDHIPSGVTGVILANELLDALPVHVVEMKDDGLAEIYVDFDGSELTEKFGPISNPEITAQLERVGAKLQPGWRAEVGLNTVEWIRNAARSLEQGFLIVIDYGHEAKKLYSSSYAHGTLSTYYQHQIDPSREQHSGNDSIQSSTKPAWLIDPGIRDLTCHVDLTAVQQVAKDEGLKILGLLDQTYFLLGLGTAENLFQEDNNNELEHLRKRLALKTLLLPGGLGSTHKVLIFGKNVGTPTLRGCSYKKRLT